MFAFIEPPVDYWLRAVALALAAARHSINYTIDRREAFVHI